jgi:hypothetical protein
MTQKQQIGASKLVAAEEAGLVLPVVLEVVVELPRGGQHQITLLFLAQAIQHLLAHQAAVPVEVLGVLVLKVTHLQLLALARLAALVAGVGQTEQQVTHMIALELQAAQLLEHKHKLVALVGQEATML